jgi:spore germination protein KB
MEKEKISCSQMFFTIVCYIQSFSLLTTFTFGIAGRDSWIPITLGGIVAILFLLIQLSVMKKYPGKSLFQINELAFGKWVGRIFSLLYLFYFFCLCFLNLRDMKDFVNFSVLPNTPSLVILVLFMMVCGWAVIKGLKVVVRYGAVFVMITLIAFILTTIFVWNRIDFHNLLPVLSISPEKLLKSTNLDAVIPFGTIIFQMIAPQLEDKKQMSSCMLKGFLCGSLFLLAVIIRDTIVLGDMVKILIFPSFSTLQLAGFTEIFQGTDVVYATLLITLEFFKVSFLYYITIAGIAELLKLKSYKLSVLIIGVGIIICSYLVYSSVMEHITSAQTIIPILWLLFEFVLPVLTLLKITFSKKRKKANQATTSS